MKADDLMRNELIVAGLLKWAEERPPHERESMRNEVLAIRERMKWEMVQEWPGLFKLYRQPDGRMVAELDSLLGKRQVKLRQGFNPAAPGYSMMNAVGAVLMAATAPPKPGPSDTDIPRPQYNAWGISNALEIHEAAMNLYRNTVADRILIKAIQEALAPLIKCVNEGSMGDRLAMAKQLKKDLGKEIDMYAQKGVAPAMVHGNKRKTNGAVEPVAVQAIEAARQLVEEHQKLPSKQAVRERLEQMFPQESKITTRSWPRNLKDAGLEGLPREASW